MRGSALVAVLALALLVGLSLGATAADLPLHRIKLPPGFTISLYASNVTAAREMAISPQGTLFVGSMKGNVYALLDTDGDHRADKSYIIAEDLEKPVGVDFHGGALYVSAVSRILKFEDIESRLDNPPPPVVVNDTFPKEAHHGWKFIRFGPDGYLYVPVGAPCNICRSADERFASIMRMRPDGTGLELFAHGVRNTVGFDWHPATRELWLTENGRDWMGEDQPPDELNHAPSKGLHFGFPFCHGGDLPDPEFGKERPCSAFVPPARKLGAHVASLGMRFYTGKMFPPSYQGQIFIAEHGSWNRLRKNGYRVSLVRLKENRAVSYEVFASGWERHNMKWGRPADVQVAPDGSLLVSDDYADAIYRISYSGPERKN
ncbi:MAG: sorbosone dehydrogenase family protein [Syntrophobacteraceae bacterium]